MSNKNYFWSIENTIKNRAYFLDVAFRQIYFWKTLSLFKCKASLDSI